MAPYKKCTPPTLSPEPPGQIGLQQFLSNTPYYPAHLLLNQKHTLFLQSLNISLTIVI
ncbi:7124_t:CDS:1, partial [Ambispora gerdemannii]